METDGDPSSKLHRVLLLALAYLLWLVGIAACAIAVLQLQSIVNVLGAILGANRYVVRLLSQASLLLGGVAAFAYAVFLEGYYREGATSGALLLRRFARTIAIPLGVIAVSLVLLEVSLRLMH